ncbi:hypothetical protein WT92_16185 [Burkholderia stagnalis]|nr:hypothetical protein WT91_29600 [Burkholderia stagnalis]KWN96024.1 hypothetical protein WT92_16185 [Burkholderia stagnalis]
MGFDAAVVRSLIFNLRAICELLGRAVAALLSVGTALARDRRLRLFDRFHRADVLGHVDGKLTVCNIIGVSERACDLLVSGHDLGKRRMRLMLANLLLRRDATLAHLHQRQLFSHTRTSAHRPLCRRRLDAVVAQLLREPLAPFLQVSFPGVQALLVDVRSSPHA